MRKSLVALLFLLGAAATLVVAAFATASSNSKSIKAHGGLIGYQEVPAVSTPANGTFEAKVNRDDSSFDWTLSYGGFEDGVVVTQAHIHLGQRTANGGISIFLCTNLGNGPAGTQACPPAPATISGTATAEDVIGPAGQGVSPGEFDEILAAIRAGKTYANVHTNLRPGGEIRGQLNDGGNN